MNLALPREDLMAGLLATAVHGFFLLLLVFGVSWQIHAPQPIMAEIWTSLPASTPQVVPVPKPEPLPAPAPTPLTQPEPRPQAEPKPKLADIALEKQKQEALERKKAEALKKQEQAQKEKALALQKQRQMADEKRRREEALQAELELEKEIARQEAEQQKRDQAKKQAELKRRELLRQEEEVLQRQMMEESLANEATQARARAAAVQRASEILKLVERYKALISDKVRSNTRLPEPLAGNPEAEFEVRVLPTGEIAKVTLIKSSGNPDYDREVQRGIEKSSPLPMPAEREAAAEFRLLKLKHKAHDY